MIVLTNRQRCRDALLAVVKKNENWRKVEDRLHFVTTFAEAQREVMRQNSLTPDSFHFVLDLGTVAHERDLAQSVGAVVEARPWLTVILLSSDDHREAKAESKAQFALRTLPSLHLMSADEYIDPVQWKKVFRDTFVERLGREIEADLVAAEVKARNGAKGELIFTQPALLELLHAAPAVKKWSDFVKLKQVSRVTLWARYRRFGHSPSELLRIFRCLWGRKLAFMGRTQSQIAHFLAQPDTAHHSRVTGTALGLKKRQLNEFSYPELVATLGECVATQVGCLKEVVREKLLHTAAVAMLVLAVLAYAGHAVGLWRGRRRTPVPLPAMHVRGGTPSAPPHHA